MVRLPSRKIESAVVTKHVAALGAFQEIIQLVMLLTSKEEIARNTIQFYLNKTDLDQAKCVVASVTGTIWLYLFLKVYISPFLKKTKLTTGLQKALLFSVSLCSFTHLVMRLHKLNWVCLLLNAVISAPSELTNPNHCIQCVHTSVAEARQGAKGDYWVKNDSSTCVSFSIGSYGGQSEKSGFETSMYLSSVIFRYFQL